MVVVVVVNALSEAPMTLEMAKRKQTWNSGTSQYQYTSRMLL